MIATLLESPWPAIWCGLFLEIVLAIALFQTQQVKLLIPMVGVLVVVLGLCLMEWLVVTEVEEVELALQELALAVQEDDVPRVLSGLAPEATQLRQTAQLLLPQFEVDEARLAGDLEISINHHTAPPMARAKITGSFQGRPRSGQQDLPYRKLIQPMELKLRRIDGRWLVSEATNTPSPSLGEH